MKKWGKAILIVLLTWGVLIVFQSLWQAEHINFLPHLLGLDNWSERSETISHSGTGLAELVVQSQNGRITLIGSDETDEITIEANYRAQASTAASAQRELEQMRTDVKQEGQRLVVQAVYARKSRESISYTITMPTALMVHAKTSNGAIQADGLSGNLVLNSSNGRITVDSAQGLQELVARTSNGTINVNASPADGGHYDLRTSNGSIRVRLPQELGISLSARTSNGSINLGAGEWSFDGGKLSKNQVTARRGDGSFELSITTSNGRITLLDE